MSVQNPERVVTKQDLADFYEQILPYLGGMPEILANKFSKSDMYSTDEKMIGQWIDGKPLYQKVINFGALPNQTTKRVASGLTDELVVFIEACAVSLAGSRPIPAVPDPTSAQASFTWGIAMEYNASTHEVIIQCGTDRSSYTGYVLLKYTKTTDSAVSIGNDTDYSTDEKIVGTWIDGRPIWQKTINFGALPNNTSKSVAHNISNISTVCNIYGIGVGSSIYQPFPILNDATPNKSVALWCDNTNVTVRATNEDYSAMVGYITIQYIKATS